MPGRNELVRVTFFAVTFSGCASVLGYGDEARLASGDAGDAGDAGSEVAPAPFCARTDAASSFCASFDGTDMLAEWEAPDTTNGTLLRSTTTLVSAPAALHAHTDAVAAGGSAGAAVSRSFSQFDSRAIHATIEFQFNVDQADPAGHFGVLANAFIFAGVGQNYILQFVCSQESSGLGCSLTEVSAGAGRTIVHPFTGALALRAWHRAVVTLDIVAPTGTGNSAHVEVDGQSRYDGALTLGATAGTPFVNIGVVAVGTPSTAWDVFYDNVRVDVR